jgi:hypothetical protein
MGKMLTCNSNIVLGIINWVNTLLYLLLLITPVQLSGINIAYHSAYHSGHFSEDLFLVLECSFVIGWIHQCQQISRKKWSFEKEQLPLVILNSMGCCCTKEETSSTNRRPPPPSGKNTECLLPAALPAFLVCDCFDHGVKYFTII